MRNQVPTRVRGCKSGRGEAGVLATTTQPRYRHAACLVNLTPYGDGVYVARNGTSLSREMPETSGTRAKEGGKRARAGRYADRRSRCTVYVTSLGRETRCVGETFRYFTIILPPGFAGSMSLKSRQQNAASEGEKEHGGKMIVYDVPAG